MSLLHVTCQARVDYPDVKTCAASFETRQTSLAHMFISSNQAPKWATLSLRFSIFLGVRLSALAEGRLVLLLLQFACLDLEVFLEDLLG